MGVGRNEKQKLATDAADWAGPWPGLSRTQATVASTRVRVSLGCWRVMRYMRYMRCRPKQPTSAKTGPKPPRGRKSGGKPSGPHKRGNGFLLSVSNFELQGQL